MLCSSKCLNSWYVVCVAALTWFIFKTICALRHVIVLIVRRGAVGALVVLSFVGLPYLAFFDDARMLLFNVPEARQIPILRRCGCKIYEINMPAAWQRLPCVVAGAYWAEVFLCE